MKTEHTPGPWHYGGLTRFVTDGEGEPVARVELRKASPTHEECVANARLIAAAPELLEALKHIEKYCQAQANETTDETALWQQARGFAMTVIARAEGRT